MLNREVWMKCARNHSDEFSKRADNGMTDDWMDKQMENIRRSTTLYGWWIKTKRRPGRASVQMSSWEDDWMMISETYGALVDNKITRWQLLTDAGSQQSQQILPVRNVSRSYLLSRWTRWTGWTRWTFNKAVRVVGVSVGGNSSGGVSLVSFHALKHHLWHVNDFFCRQKFIRPMRESLAVSAPPHWRWIPWPWPWEYEHLSSSGWRRRRDVPYTERGRRERVHQPMAASVPPGGGPKLTAPMPHKVSTSCNTHHSSLLHFFTTSCSVCHTHRISYTHIHTLFFSFSLSYIHSTYSNSFAILFSKYLLTTSNPGWHGFVLNNILLYQYSWYIDND